MATTLSINQLKAVVGWDYETTLAYGNNIQSNSFTYSKTLSQGSGSGNANKIYIVQGDGTSGASAVIASSGTVAIDLTSLTDVFGNAISFSAIRGLYLENTSATATTITLTPGVSNGWAGASALIQGTTPVLRVGPGGVSFNSRNDSTGFVVDGTHKNLVLTNEDSGNPASYKLVIIGS